MSAQTSAPAKVAAVRVQCAQPLVSVVLPTHNRAALLARAIDSVLAQTHAALELIVVDDASSDGTRETVLSVNDKRVRYLRHAHNRGGSAARNTGVRAATGEYVAFLDDDDTWQPTKIERQLQQLAGHDAVICGFRLRTPAGDIPGSRADGAERTVSASRLRRGYVGWGTSSLMLRRAVADTVPFDEELPVGQDWDVLIRVAQRHSILYVDEPLVVFDIGAHARISTAGFDLAPAKIEARMRVLYKHANFLGRFWFNYHAAGMRLYRVRRRTDAWRQIFRTVRQHGLITVAWRFVILQLQGPGRY
jgi:glycosyltransferase involved in cell wall biosynthesis